MESDKRECILMSAAKSFTRFGFKKASIESIAKDAGVAKGTVYLACESKEDLFYQALHRELRHWIAEVAKCIDPRRPADELLGTVALAGFSFFDAHPLVRDLFNGEHHAMLPQWVDRLDDLRSLGRANTIEILRLGMRQGRFRQSLDLEEVASLLQDLNLSTYLFHTQASAGRPERLARRLEAGLDLVLNGLRISPSA